MPGPNREKTLLLIGLILTIVSIISMHVAMIFYPGGTFIDKGTDGYIFWQNFLSDLGMTVSHSGAANPIACVLFNISIISMGGAFIAAFSALPALYSDSREVKLTSLLGTSFGIITGLLFFVVSLFPQDLNFELHLLFAQFMYLTLMLTCACYTIATVLSKDIFIKYTLIYLSIALMVFFVTVIALVIQPNPLTPEGLFIFVVGQKSIHYTIWIGFILATYGLRRRMY